MNDYKERLALLSEMIAFSVVDGRLHEREYFFLSMVADELQLDKGEFNNLFHQEEYPIVIKSEFERIQQFYRLALLMHCDGVLHEREQNKIHEIGINMGLDPYAMKRALKLIEDSPNHMVDGETLIKMFSEQLN